MTQWHPPSRFPCFDRNAVPDHVLYLVAMSLQSPFNQEQLLNFTQPFMTLTFWRPKQVILWDFSLWARLRHPPRRTRIWFSGHRVWRQPVSPLPLAMLVLNSWPRGLQLLLSSLINKQYVGRNFEHMQILCSLSDFYFVNSYLLFLKTVIFLYETFTSPKAQLMLFHSLLPAQSVCDPAVGRSASMHLHNGLLPLLTFQRQGQHIVSTYFLVLQISDIIIKGLTLYWKKSSNVCHFRLTGCKREPIL